MRGSVVEVKNVRSLSITPQLRDLAVYAESQGVVLEIFSSAAVPLRGELAGLIERGTVIVKPLP